MMTNERVPGHTTLRASWTLERGGLIVTYTITSAEPHRNLLTFDGGRGDPSCEVPNLTDQVYVSFEQPNTVHIKRVSPPLPIHKDITSVRIPAVRRLEPGETSTATFQLDVPLRERSEYFPHHPDVPYSTHHAQRLTFWLGYIPETPEVPLEALNEELGIYRIRGSIRDQQFVTDSGSVDVEVLVRQDSTFERV
jgi:hypothetical protein